MSIKMKILIPMVVLTVVVSCAILLAIIFKFSSYVNTSLEERVHSAMGVAADELNSMKSKANATSMSIANDKEIIQAMAEGDRETIINRANLIMSGSGMEFCSISDTSGIAIARPHAPDKFGDDISAMPSVRSALSGKDLTAIETGVSVRMSVCAGTPVYSEQGELLGAIVTGIRLDTPTFVDKMKNLLNCEITVFCEDERISTTVENEKGERAIGTKSAETVSKTVLAGNTYTGRAKILNKDALTEYTPITDPDGKVLGMLFAGYYMTEESKTINTFIFTGVLIILVMLAVSIPVILLIAGRIVKPIGTMLEAARALSKGDTDINLQINTKDEMRLLAGAFREMIENTQKQVGIIEAIADGDLTADIEERSDKDVMNKAIKSMLKLNNDVFSQIVGAANQVFSGAHQMADHSQSLAQGSTEQSSTIEQLSASINEVSGEARESEAMAEKAALLAHTIKSSAQKGSEQMGQMVQAVKEINEASQSINKIIKVIDDIAFQTNILALNAAVEAARAGQHGKGFAVVADEVRSLAAKSAEAAKDTGSIIENSITKAELGVRIANETAVSLSEIVLGINESGSIVDEISKSSKQQNIYISQINDGISQVANVIHQNSATAEESAAASEEMSGQAGLLQNLVSRFNIRNAGKSAGMYSAAPNAAPNTGVSVSPKNDGAEKY